jgi:hypothetical protein
MFSEVWIDRGTYRQVYIGLLPCKDTEIVHEDSSLCALGYPLEADARSYCCQVCFVVATRHMSCKVLFSIGQQSLLRCRGLVLPWPNREWRMMQLVECVHVTSSNNRQGRKQWDCGTAWVGTEGMMVPTQKSFSGMSLCFYRLLYLSITCNDILSSVIL